MATANRIIRSALGKLGLVAPGESVKPGDAADCLIALNTMLDAWRVESLYAYATQTLTAMLPPGTQAVSIGPGATLNITPRPVRIEGGFFRVGSTDYPFDFITEDQWNAIEVKGTFTVAPEVVHYEATLPAGTLRLFPGVAGSAEAHIDVQVQLAAFADLTTDYALAQGYERALLFSLAEEVAADFEREVPPTVARNAANARRLLKRANHSVPQLDVCDVDITQTKAYLFGGA
jgi:hypothetical protein